MGRLPVVATLEDLDEAALKRILLDTMFDLPSLEGVEEVVISREVVEGSARPLYIYADRAGDAGASAS